MFTVFGVMCFALGYAAAKWFYASVIASLKGRIELKHEQAETYKEEALRNAEKAREFATAKPPELRQKTLDFVKRLKDFLDQHQRMELTEMAYREQDMLLAGSDREELTRRFKHHGQRSWQSHSEKMAAYDREFKTDAIILRDELRSRLKDYKPDTNGLQRSYENAVNDFGWRYVANDLEKMAKLIQ
ncbi:hypothetical protein CSV86_009465 [Pseudomonas putida CSV86]|uniref:Uncharacterized protein n=1 Tax=Pseudomonas bharatica CSV86 TaxID=1005395 RepID=A0A7K4ECS5_9PSED|nr:hypothetical protein [Pseudomonas bharatica]NNJ15444.1 hypothetical protein [Pseudomonas bharatica CSV86]